MKRALSTVFVFSLLAGSAQASAGFGCETAEKEMPRLVVEGATPRSGNALINFGGVLEIDGKKIELKKSDGKSFAWSRGALKLRAVTEIGGDTYTINVSAKADPKDEDEWAGTYEITYGPKAKPKANVKRGKVKCTAE